MLALRSRFIRTLCLPSTRVQLIPSRLFFSNAQAEKKQVDGEIAETCTPEQTPEPAPSTEQPADEELMKQSKALEQAERAVRELHGSLLLKYANAENKRRDRSAEVKRRDTSNIKKFADKTYTIYESLEKVNEIARVRAESPEAGEKVKSLSEGLKMTRDIMRNILEKHNVATPDKK